MTLVERISGADPRPPGPGGLPYLGSVFTYARDPLGFLVDTARVHGDVAYSRFGGTDTFLVSHPDGIEHVLVSVACHQGSDVCDNTTMNCGNADAVMTCDEAPGSPPNISGSGPCGCESVGCG